MGRLTLLARSYCHLCDDMMMALDDFKGRFSISLEIDVVDVDRFPALEEKWGEKVPVLLSGDREICHYFLDEAALRRIIAE